MIRLFNLLIKFFYTKLLKYGVHGETVEETRKHFKGFLDLKKKCFLQIVSLPGRLNYVFHVSIAIKLYKNRQIKGNEKCEKI